MPGTFSDYEVQRGWLYAKTSRQDDGFVGVATDKDLLRNIANNAEKRRRSGVLLPALVGTVCREYLRQRNIREEQTYEAYLCGVMKMFADRSARSAHARAVRKKERLPAQRSGQKFAELPNGQFLLPLPRPRGSTRRVS